MPTYPKLNEASLIPFKALMLQLKDDPDLFSRSECPYEVGVKDFLAELLGGAQEPKSYDDDNLVHETIKLFEVAKEATQMTVADPKDRVAMVKNASDLLGKLIAMRQTAMNIRSMSQFQKTVIEVLEGVLEPHQRSEFIEKLANVR